MPPMLHVTGIGTAGLSLVQCSRQRSKYTPRDVNSSCMSESDASSRMQAYFPSDDISGSRPAIAGGRPHFPPAEEGATLSPAQRREIYIKLERHVEQRHRIVSLLESEDDTTLSSNAGVTYASGSSRSVSVRDELAYHDDLVGPKSRRDGKEPARGLPDQNGDLGPSHDGKIRRTLDHVDSFYHIRRVMRDAAITAEFESIPEPLLQTSRGLVSPELFTKRLVPPLQPSDKQDRPQGHRIEETAIARSLQVDRDSVPRSTHVGSRRALQDGPKMPPLDEGGDGVDKLVDLLGNPTSNSEAFERLMRLASPAIVEHSRFSGDIISKITALFRNPNDDVCVSAMSILEVIAQHGASRKSFPEDIVPRCALVLFETASSMVYATAECLLESLAQYDDFSTNFSSIDIFSKISAWLENPRDGDDGALRVMVNVLAILSRHDATRSIYVDAIHELVTMLGHTNTVIHARSARIISRLAMEAVDETIMVIVTHVNNPSEDISELSTSILFAFRQHDATHNRLSRADIILKLVSFMDSDLIHVRCCLMATFALLADKENTRTTILRHKLLPIMCDMLYKDKASSRMLSRLLWSFGQFMQYDDLRSAILQTDVIYALARLRSSKRLPEDSKTFLSDLIVNESLSLSFTPDSDDSSVSPFTSFQCLVGAQEAMEKVLSEEAALEKLLDYHQIKPQDYFVQAGFDEDLLNSGGVHLEEIYIYLIKEVEMQASGMLDDLAKLFRPFPCVLLTPENSYRTPTLPDLPLGFDSVILERGNWHYQILKLTKHKEGQGSSEPMIDGESIPEGGGGGHLRHDSLARERGDDRDDGSKKPPPTQGPPGSGGGGDGGAGEDTNDDSEPSDMELDSSVERQVQMGTPKVVCDSHVEVNFPKPAVSSNSSKRGSPPSVDTLFQQFGMHAVMAVDVQSPSGPDPASVSLRYEHLGFYTDPLALEHPYENSKIQVKVDSSDKRVYPWTWFPESTTANARTLTETNEHEVTGGVSVAIGTKNGVSVTGKIGGRIAHGQEATRNLSRITALHGDTFVKWSYYVDDTYQQQDGLRVEHDRLPSLEFWLRKASAERPFCVELSSYWVSRVTPKKGTKFLSAFKKRQALPLLRNFCHLTCITLPPYIPRSAISTLRLGAHMPCSTEECIAVQLVEEDFELGIEMEGQVILQS